MLKKLLKTSLIKVLDSLIQMTYNFKCMEDFNSGEFLLETLKKKSDFNRVYSTGRSKATNHLVLYWLKNNENKNRYGFSISKKIGKAVIRNKIRRRLKEIIRDVEKKKNIYLGYDIIFIARKPVIKLNYHDLSKDVYNLFKKTGLIKR